MKETLVSGSEYIAQEDEIDTLSIKSVVRTRTDADSPNDSFLPGVFLRQVDSAVRASVASRGARLNGNLRSRLAQFWFGNDRTIHYEVWIHERTAQIELGLHFEASESRNRELYRQFERELLAIQAILGSSVWLEQWDRGWSRIYETQPLWPLDSVRVQAITARLNEMIDVFQPILEAS